MTGIIIASLVISVVASVALVFAWADIQRTQREEQLRRESFERMNAILGPIMEQWEEELREQGMLVPPGTRRM
jgi:hypothetical protein